MTRLAHFLVGIMAWTQWHRASLTGCRFAVRDDHRPIGTAGFPRAAAPAISSFVPSSSFPHVANRAQREDCNARREDWDDMAPLDSTSPLPTLWLPHKKGSVTKAQTPSAQ